MLDSNIIVDNSTLSSIQRITGQIQVPQNYSIEGDYSAFENFLSSLMFYDNFYFIDDYKEEHRKGRRSQFGYLRPISIDSFPYPELEKHSVDITDHLLLDIRGGKVSSSALTDFLEVMGLHLTCAWQMQSSDFFLTLKVLSDSLDYDEERYKYSPLTSMIFNQINDGEIDSKDINKLYLESRDGDIIEESPYQKNKQNFIIGAQLKAFSNSLNWLSRRSAFYSLASGHLNAAACLHPIRHNFLASYSIEDNFFSCSKIWRDKFRDYFGDRAKETVNEINEGSETTEIGFRMPLFATWAVGNAGDPAKAIDMILDFRMEKSPRKLREYLNELENERVAGANKKNINLLRAAIKNEQEKLRKNYGIGEDSAYCVNVGASIGTSFGLSISKAIELPNPGMLFGQAKHARSMYRTVVEDIARFPSLGSVRRKMLSLISRDEKTREGILQIEERRFRNARPHWKIPM